MTGPGDDEESTVRAVSPALSAPTVPEQPRAVTLELTPTRVDPLPRVAAPPPVDLDDEATRLNPPRREPRALEAPRRAQPPAPRIARARVATMEFLARKPRSWRVVAAAVLVLGLLLVGLWRNSRAEEPKKARPTKDGSRAVEEFFEGK